jgi:hypothetical protein
MTPLPVEDYVRWSIFAGVIALVSVRQGMTIASEGET